MERETTYITFSCPSTVRPNVVWWCRDRQHEISGAKPLARVIRTSSPEYVPKCPGDALLKRRELHEIQLTLREYAALRDRPPLKLPGHRD